MALEAEGCLGDAFDSGINVGIGVDNNGVFAAHFEDSALDPDLAGSLRGGDMVDVQSNFARAGESDVAGFRMRPTASPKLAPAPGQKFTTPSGSPTSSSSSMNFAAMVGESLDGFRITVLPLTMDATVMPAIMAQGKFQGGILRPRPAGCS